MCHEGVYTSEQPAASAGILRPVAPSAGCPESAVHVSAMNYLGKTVHNTATAAANPDPSCAWESKESTLKLKSINSTLYDTNYSGKCQTFHHYTRPWTTYLYSKRQFDWYGKWPIMLIRHWFQKNCLIIFKDEEMYHKEL